MSHTPWWKRPSPDETGARSTKPKSSEKPSSEKESSEKKPKRQEASKPKPPTEAAPPPDAELKKPREEAEPAAGAEAGDESPRESAPDRTDDDTSAPAKPREDAPASESERPRRSRRRSRRRKRGSHQPEREPESAPIVAETPTATGGAGVIVFADVESVARLCRELDVDTEEAGRLLSRAIERVGSEQEAGGRRAYASGNRHARLQRVLADAGFQLVEVAGSRETLRLRLAMDALEACISGSSESALLMIDDDELVDLAARLRRCGVQVTICGRERDGLIDAADHHLGPAELGETVDRGREPATERRRPPRKEAPTAPRESPLEPTPEDQPPPADAYELLQRALVALRNGPPRLIWGSILLEAMQEIDPSFNESVLGCDSFDDVLEEAARRDLIALERKPETGTYLIVGAA